MSGRKKQTVNKFSVSEHVYSSIWQTRPGPPRRTGFSTKYLLVFSLNKSFIFKIDCFETFKSFLYQLYTDHETNDMLP
jgi:hypothetical protein